MRIHTRGDHDYVVEPMRTLGLLKGGIQVGLSFSTTCTGGQRFLSVVKAFIAGVSS